MQANAKSLKFWQKLRTSNKEIKTSIKRAKDKLISKKKSMKQTHDIAKRD